MYWPLGIPNCYSISKRTASEQDNAVAEDILSHGEESSHTNGTRRLAQKEEEGGGGEGGADDHTGQGAASSNVHDKHAILDLKTCRGAHIFASITSTTLSIWQTKPTVLLSTTRRSTQSLSSYGDNVALSVRADALVVVVQTQLDFLITYTLAVNPNSQVYQIQLRTPLRRPSDGGIRRTGNVGPDYGPGDGSGIADVRLRFRMAMRIDAGIKTAIALDDELMVATKHPPSIQSIKWTPNRSGASHDTYLLRRMPWFADRHLVADMVFDKPMGLYVWLSHDGKAYAVQKTHQRRNSDRAAESPFNGYCFHNPRQSEEQAVSVAVNARFSLIAVACADAEVRVYAARDYLGNIPISHVLKPPVSKAASGSVTFLAHSPDGYCTFVGYERGWAMWSVYGKLGATSFSVDPSRQTRSQDWLNGIIAGFWTGAGSELVLLSSCRTQLFSVNMARAAATGCFNMPNIFRSLLQTSTSLLRYRGHGLGVTSSISGDEQQWQTLQIPAAYLGRQWPMRSSVISACDKYIAVAGRRGLAHYSTTSGRWKTFDDAYAEDEFAVRGGMCWYQHILIAAVDADGRYQLRLYSREKNLSSSSALFTQEVKQPIIHISVADSSSLLVYTHENVLLHYVFEASANSVKLVQVGQIGFGGIIRAPARVRSISWIVPDEQRERGEPSQDVATAAVLFLIDGKLVLLQPSPEEDRELKYDMRVIAHDVEFYLLAREGATRAQTTSASQNELVEEETFENSLEDSLWYFNGHSMRVWPDVHELVSSTSSELGQQQTAMTVTISTDFYPLTPIIDKGIIAGLEPEIVQRPDVDFAYCRTQPRTHLFIPSLLQHYLSRFDSPAALHLSHSYTRLPYFAHALEVLLHDVLDREVDALSSSSAATDNDAPARPDGLQRTTSSGDSEAVSTAEHQLDLVSLLPFLSSFPSYLEVVVSCARKTELRSWHTLFRHLPPVTRLFEQALEERREGALKTAAGFLLVLHTFDEESFNAGMMSRLLVRAREAGDWDLCKELARFLVGIDASGKLLGDALRGAGMRLPPSLQDGTVDAAAEVF